jgi:hypothetical protein
LVIHNKYQAIWGPEDCDDEDEDAWSARDHTTHNSHHNGAFNGTKKAPSRGSENQELVFLSQEA